MGFVDKLLYVVQNRSLKTTNDFLRYMCENHTKTKNQLLKNASKLSGQKYQIKFEILYFKTFSSVLNYCISKLIIHFEIQYF